MAHFYALATPRNCPVLKIGSPGFRAKNGRGRQSNHLLKGQFEIFRRPPRKMVGTTARSSEWLIVITLRCTSAFHRTSSVNATKRGENCNNMHSFFGARNFIICACISHYVKEFFVKIFIAGAIMESCFCFRMAKKTLYFTPLLGYTYTKAYTCKYASFSTKSQPVLERKMACKI